MFVIFQAPKFCNKAYTESRLVADICNSCEAVNEARDGQMLTELFIYIILKNENIMMVMKDDIGLKL